MNESMMCVPLSPRLLGELELLLAQSRRFELLETLCLERTAGSTPAPWSTWLRLHDARQALGRNDPRDLLESAIQAAAAAGEMPALAKRLGQRRDWRTLLHLRVEQIRSGQNSPEQHLLLRQAFRRACEIGGVAEPVLRRLREIRDAKLQSIVAEFAEKAQFSELANLAWLDAVDLVQADSVQSDWLAGLLIRQRRWAPLVALRQALVTGTRSMGTAEKFAAEPQLSVDGLPESDLVAWPWLLAIESSGEMERFVDLVPVYLNRQDHSTEGLGEIAKVLRRLELWDLLGQLRVRQWCLDPGRKETISFHIKTVRTAAPEQDLHGFFVHLAAAPVDDPAACAFVVRTLVANGDDGALRTFALNQMSRRPMDPQPCIDLIEHWSFDEDTGEAEFEQRVGHLRELLLHAPAPPAFAEATEDLVLDPCRLQEGSWLASVCKGPIRVLPFRMGPLVEALAAATHRRGVFEVWAGYDQRDIKSAERVRRPNEIRVARRSGELLAWLVRQRQPQCVVEIGSGFGTSGMYLCAALEEVGAGRLLTFEPNAIWHGIARDNILRISHRVTAVNGPFEAHHSMMDGVLVEMAFIDAIHTPEAVEPQLEAVLRHCAPGAVIVIDDIRFSRRMYAYWRDLALEPRWAASCEYAGRFGILEMAASEAATH